MAVRWLLEFAPEAERDLAKLDRLVRRRIIGRLHWLLENFDTLFPPPLSGAFKDFYKLRVGDWRVLYHVRWEKHAFTIYLIDHRSRVYRRKRQ